jgi:hypothetical protein
MPKIYDVAVNVEVFDYENAAGEAALDVLDALETPAHIKMGNTTCTETEEVEQDTSA